MAQYTITGYDASAHMSEETRAGVPLRGGRHGHVRRGRRWSSDSSCWSRSPSRCPTCRAPSTPRRTPSSTSGRRRSATAWAEFLLLIAVVAQLFCGTASVTSASRMMFAFSRDRAVPGLADCGARSRRNRVPVNAVIAICVLAWALMLPTPGQRRRRLPRRHVDRGDRPLHRVRAADHPADQGGRAVRAGRVDARQALQVDRPARGRLDRDHLHPVPAAHLAQRDPGRRGVRLGGRELRAAHRRSAR